MFRVDRLSERLVGRKLFYGWVIVLIAFTTSMVTAGIGTYGLSFFVIPMSQELGVSRAAFSSVTLFRLVPLFVVPFLGLLADKKHGPRLLLTLGGILAGIALIFTARVHSLGEFYLIYGALFGLALITIGGQLVGPAVLSKWFVRKRGRAMAIGNMGISAGGLIIAPLAGWLIGQFGWRMAWAVLGVVLLLAVTPVSALFMRRQPEDIGLLPDGASPAGTPVGREARSRTTWAETEYPWTVRQALRTRALWVLLAVQSLGSTALSPVLIHQVAYIEDKGHDLQTATAVATTLAFFALVSKLPWGYLTERAPIRWVVSLCLVPAGLSLLLLVWAPNSQVLYAYAVLHGFTIGGWATLMNVVWATYFGRQHTGAIRGTVTPASNVIGAVSPVFAAWMWDRTGSYNRAFIVFSGAWMLAGLLTLFAKPPRPPEAGSAAMGAVDGIHAHGAGGLDRGGGGA